MLEWRGHSLQSWYVCFAQSNPANHKLYIALDSFGAQFLQLGGPE